MLISLALPLPDRRCSRFLARVALVALAVCHGSALVAQEPAAVARVRVVRDVAIFAGAGALLGGLLGAIWPYEHWSRVH